MNEFEPSNLSLVLKELGSKSYIKKIKLKEEKEKIERQLYIENKNKIEEEEKKKIYIIHETTHVPPELKKIEARLYVGNLDFNFFCYSSGKKKIEKIFSKYGKMTIPIILKNGYCFIQYEDESSVINAITYENGNLYGNRKIICSRAKGYIYEKQQQTKNLINKDYYEFPIFIKDDNPVLSKMFFKIFDNLKKILPEHNIVFFFSTNLQIKKFLEIYNKKTTLFSACLENENIEKETIFIRTMYCNNTTNGFEEIKINEIENYIKKQQKKNENIEKKKILIETTERILNYMYNTNDFTESMDDLLIFLKNFINKNIE